jgi:hypothetical protein
MWLVGTGLYLALTDQWTSAAAAWAVQAIALSIESSAAVTAAPLRAGVVR